MRKFALFSVLASPCQDKYRRLHDGADSSLYIQKPHTINDISANHGQQDPKTPFHDLVGQHHGRKPIHKAWPAEDQAEHDRANELEPEHKEEGLSTLTFFKCSMWQKICVMWKKSHEKLRYSVEHNEENSHWENALFSWSTMVQIAGFWRAFLRFSLCSIPLYLCDLSFAYEHIDDLHQHYIHIHTYIYDIQIPSPSNFFLQSKQVGNLTT